MPKQITPAMKRKIIDALKAGASKSEVARRLRVSRPAVRDIAIMHYGTQDVDETETTPDVAPRVLPPDTGRPADEKPDERSAIERALEAAGETVTSEAGPVKPGPVALAPSDDDAREKCIAFFRENTNMAVGIAGAFVSDEDKDLVEKLRWNRGREAAIDPFAAQMWGVVRVWAEALGENAATAGFIALGLSYLPPIMEFVKRRRERAEKEEPKKGAA